MTHAPSPRSHFLSSLEEQGLATTALDAHDALSNATNLLSLSRNAKLVWRGQSDASWEPIPSLYRRLALTPFGLGWTPPLLNRIASSVIEEANSRGFVHGAEGKDWAYLQHYGVATGLLDVTADDRAAAWFAVEDERYWDRDGVIFAFCVQGLEPPPGLPSHLEDRQPQISYVHYDSLDPRIAAQRGGFLMPRMIFGDFRDLAPLLPEKAATDTALPEPVDGGRADGPCPRAAAIIVPAECKAELLGILNSTGYSSRFMYPDFPGFCVSESANSRIGQLARFGITIDKSFRETLPRPAPCIVRRDLDTPSASPYLPADEVRAWLLPCETHDAKWFPGGKGVVPVLILVNEDGCTDAFEVEIGYEDGLARITLKESEEFRARFRGSPIKSNPVPEGLAYTDWIS